MKSGISPIVAVVLIIAIAVTASVGLYFWVGGLSTKQPTTETPITMNAQTVQCNTGNSNGLPNSNVSILVQNLDASRVLNKWILITGNSGVLLQNSSPLGGGTGISPSSQSTVVLTNATRITAPALTQGSIYVISSNESGVSTAQFVC
jgi:flagellin-like protein